MSTGSGRFDPIWLLVAALVVTGCGKKGPPLPPLVHLPTAPGNLVAERRGDRVDVRFVVPAENTDGSRPANIRRVDVHAWTGLADLADDLLLKQSTRIGTVDVKAPRDPDDTVDPDEPIADVEPLVGPGLDQGAAAQVSENLTADTSRPIDIRQQAPGEDAGAQGPLVGPGNPVPTRTYVAIGISTSGRRGAVSRRVAVPLLPAPPAPAQPEVTYDETSITVSWPPAPGSGAIQAPASDQVLQATPFGLSLPTVAYHVYQITPAEDGSDEATKTRETRLTEMPVVEPRFVDSRIAWGIERCYTVRVVHGFNDLPIESEAAAPRCTKLTDTFAPAPPRGLTPVASEGAINLIWDPSTEKDLRGYIVLRGSVPGGKLTPLTQAPIPSTGFTDKVQTGVRHVYAVQAVDTAGNVSATSDRVEETAR